MTFTPITIHHYLILAAILFCLGFLGVIVRRNLIIQLMCLEIVLNAIILVFIAFAKYFHLTDGHVTALIIMAIAAVEAAIGLGIAFNIYKLKKDLDTQKLNSMKG